VRQHRSHGLRDGPVQFENPLQRWVVEPSGGRAWRTGGGGRGEGCQRWRSSLFVERGWRGEGDETVRRNELEVAVQWVATPVERKHVTGSGIVTRLPRMGSGRVARPVTT
jgi:hypothetical protein